MSEALGFRFEIGQKVRCVWLPDPCVVTGRRYEDGSLTEGAGERRSYAISDEGAEFTLWTRVPEEKLAAFEEEAQAVVEKELICKYLVRDAVVAVLATVAGEECNCELWLREDDELTDAVAALAGNHDADCRFRDLGDRLQQVIQTLIPDWGEGD